MIQIEIPSGISDLSSVVVSIDSTGSIAQLTKTLKFRGLITLDRYDRPIGGQLTGVTARDDDPGLAQWPTLSHSHPTVTNAVLADLLKTLASTNLAALQPNVGQDLLRNWSTNLAALQPNLGQDLLRNWSTNLAALQANLAQDLLRNWSTNLAALQANRAQDLLKNWANTNFPGLQKTAGATLTPPTSLIAEVVEPETPDSAEGEIEGDDTEEPDIGS